MIHRHFTTDGHLRWALVLWVILAVGVGVKIVCCGADCLTYPVFAASSRHWWADRPLYAPYGPTEVVDEFRYSPTFAVAFTPLAYLPDRLGEFLGASRALPFSRGRRTCWCATCCRRHGGKRGQVQFAATNLRSVPARRRAPCLHGRRTNWTCPLFPPAEGMFLTLTLGGSAMGIWSGQSNALVLALIALGLAAIAGSGGGRPPFCWPCPCSSSSGRWRSCCC